MSKHVYQAKQKRPLAKIINNLPEELALPSITEWAEENRYYPPGVSPFYGGHSSSTAPHMVEILERMHPDDPTTWCSVMKSVQSTATTHAECAIGYYIRYKLASMGYYTATQELARIRGSANIDTMIDNSGLAECVKPHSNRNNRKKSDSSTYKEFLGGIKLTLNSYGSIAGMKSNTIPFMILDEIDEAIDDLKGQGDTLAILEGRTIAVRNPKIFVISTPTIMETSKIYRLFREGDQRHYYVPCPHCGERQVLDLKKHDVDYGLTFSREKSKKTGKKILIPETVRYICRHCGKDIYESKKQQMLEDGEWRAHAESIDPRRHSYHVSGLYSPEMFLSWDRICQQFINADFGKDLLKFKDFTINYLGLPWAHVEKQQTWEFLQEKADDYTLGEVPNGCLRIYGGCDVQGDRLELAVVGTGIGLEKWLIDYQVFYGDPGAGLHDPSWIALEEFCRTTTYSIKGAKIRISMTGVDTGYDPGKHRDKDWDSKSHLVYQFVGPRQHMFKAIKGFQDLKTFDIIKEARANSGYLTKYYQINTSVLKEMIYRDIELTGGPGTIHFPQWQMISGIKRPLDGERYKQMMSERYQEISPGKMGWKKMRPRNETLDCFLYAVAQMYLENVQTWTGPFWEMYAKKLVG